MAGDSRLTDLDELTSPLVTDIIEVTSDPSGTPHSYKCQVVNMLTVPIHAATSKTTPIDADEIGLIDSNATYGLKKLTWANLKATLKTYFDSLYTGTTQESYTTGDFTKQNSTALANVTGLSATLVSAGVYRFKASLHSTSGASGGVKVALSGTATATSISAVATIFGATSSVTARVTALDSATGSTIIAPEIVIDGIIVCNVGGTFTVQFAQNASNAAASTVYTNSSFTVVKIA